MRHIDHWDFDAYFDLAFAILVVVGMIRWLTTLS